MPTAPTPIPNIPTPVPSADDPGNFDDRADDTLVAMPPAIDGMNDAADNVYANAVEVFDKAAEIAAAALVATDAAGLVGRSNSPLVVGAGTKSVTLLAAKPNLAVLNKRVVIVQISDPSIRMFGTISSVTSSTAFAVTVVSSGAFGSGNYSSWQIIDAAFFGSAATKEDLWAGTSDAAAPTPKTIRDAKVWVPLIDGATVTPNGLVGRNFTWTIGGNRALAAITNCSPNDTFLLEITQDGTGSRILAWASGVYFRAGGLPVLSTAAGGKDYLQLRVISVDGSGTATRVLVTFIRAPTN